MRYPSVKTLSLIMPLEKAKIARAILLEKNRMTICEQSNAANNYTGACYNKVPVHLLKLYAINELMEGYGIEAIDLPEGSFSNCQTPDVCIEYVNMGDAYALTLCRIERKHTWGIKATYRVCSWGDIVERER